MQLKRSITFVNKSSSKHAEKAVWVCLDDSSGVLNRNGFFTELPNIGRPTQFKVGSKVTITIEEPEDNNFYICQVDGEFDCNYKRYSGSTIVCCSPDSCGNKQVVKVSYDV